MSDEGLMPLKDAAAYLGIKPGTLRQWVQKRRISYVALGRPKFRKADLDRFIERQYKPAVQRIKPFKPGTRKNA